MDRLFRSHLDNPHRLFMISATLWCVLMIASSAAGQTYTVTDIGTLGGTFSIAVNVNDYGEVVGFSKTAKGDPHGFLYLRDGTLMDIQTRDGVRSFVHAITNSGILLGETQTVRGETHPFLGVLNDTPFDFGDSYHVSSVSGANSAGDIVGCRMAIDGHGELQKRAFLYINQHLIDLGTFGGKQGEATAINDSGQVLGHLYTAYHGGFQRAIIYSDGKTVEIGTLGGSASIGVAINNSGQVVGYAPLPGGDQRAFLYSGRTIRNLGTLPGGTQSFAYGINRNGLVVGSSDSKDALLHAFIYRDRSMQDLNTMIPANSGWVLIEARAINEVGQIVGVGIIKGQQHAFLLTPASDVTHSQAKR